MNTLWRLQKSVRGDWHYNKQLDVYQKVNDRVFVYVSRLIGGYMCQLYLRGAMNMGICQLEVRTQSNLNKMFKIGERWLTKYHSGDMKLIRTDMYSISNPLGVWGISYNEKLYWIE